MSAANDRRSAGQNWVEIIGRKSLDAFAAAFTEDAVLEASVLRDPVKGPSGIRSVFSATAAMTRPSRSRTRRRKGQRLISNGKVRPSGGSRRPASRC